MAARRSPACSISFATVIAFLMPWCTSYVSSSSTQFFGLVFANARNASSSVGNAITHEWACVPNTGMP